MSPLELGEVTVTRVIEIDRSSFPTLSMLPDSFFEVHAGSGVLILAAHFPTPGFIVRKDGGFRFAPMNGR